MHPCGAVISCGSYTDSFWGFEIGIIAVSLKEILDRFGFSELFFIGDLEYKEKVLDTFKTYRTKNKRIPLWGIAGFTTKIWSYALWYT